MKRFLSLLLVLALCCSAALADVTVSTAAPVDSSVLETVTDLTVDWYAAATGNRCVLTWKADGNSYEARIAGLDEKLTDKQVQQLLYAWRTRSTATVTGGVTDAEKYTNKLGYKTGEWLVTDTEERKQECWGDTSMCWAAATANMLWNSGWATKAVNPYTGAAFASEDEVFTLFIRHFLNDGGWSTHGVRWFFTGSCDELDLKERWENNDATSIAGYDPKELLHSTLNEENPANTNPATMAEFVSVIRRMKDGAAVGMSIGFNEEHYHMPNNQNDAVWWSVQHNTFVHSPSVNITPDDCTRTTYTFDEEGYALPVTQQGDQWIDENGAAVRADGVLTGLLYNCYGHWWVAEPFGENEVILPVEVPVSTDEFDLNDMEQQPVASHMHAVTVSGYVMNLSAKDPGDMIEALFIANSDDDAAIWRLTDETTSREDRPNKYTMYPTSVHECDEGAEMRTICLEQFMEHNLTLVNHVVALDAMTE